MDEILTSLSNLGVGCYVGEVFIGALGYADDLVLPAPSRTAMQLVLDVCQDFGKKNNLLFRTDPDPRQSVSSSVAERGRKNKAL